MPPWWKLRSPRRSKTNSVVGSMPIRSEADESHTSPFGLFRLQPDDNGSPSSSQQNTNIPLYNVDLIAIHGLGGTAYNTWTHENNSFWLRDFAPSELPGARLYTFGYDSGFAFSRGTGTLRDFARSLLEGIKVERNTYESRSRPILLICHSMGGIVAKLAVIISRNEPELYPGIGKAVKAILFLGTPHQGSGSAKYATILAHTANALVVGSQMSRFTGPMRTDLLQTLQRHESSLLQVAEDFRVHTTSIQVYSFVEGKEMKGMNFRIVDDHSAFVGAANERKIPMPGYDHREICRHSSRNDHGYKLILGSIKDCISNPNNPASLPIFALSSELDTPINSSLTQRLKGSTVPFVHIPFRQNLDFVGQGNVLAELMLNLDKASTNRHVALYGLGGIGKSQIALQYAYHVKETDPASCIFWVFAATRERFEYDYRRIAEALNLPSYQDPKVNILKLVKSSLEKPDFGKWLMVIDNADDLSIFHGSKEASAKTDTGSEYQSDYLFKYLPDCETGSVIYTTRNKADALKLTSDGHVIHVEEMEANYLMELLRNKLHNDEADETEGHALIEALDRLPLAVVQAVSYIRQNSWSIPKYLQHFRGKDSDVTFQFLLHDFRDRTRDKTMANPVFKTWVITALQLEEQHPQAAEILWKMSVYNRQKIPRYLLSNFSALSLTDSHDGSDCHDTIQEPGLSRVSSEIQSEYTLDRAIGTLIAYSFINVSSEGPMESYNIHRLVQVFAQYWVKEFRHSALEYAVKALDSLARHFPVVEYEDWAKCAELLPHIQGIIDCQGIVDLPAATFGQLLTAASTYLRLNAHYALASQYITLGIAALVRALGDEDALTIDARSCLARCLYDERRYEEAEKLFKAVIEQYAHASGVKPSKKYLAMSYLAGNLRAQGKLAEAASVCQESVDGLIRLQGPSGTETLLSRMCLATIFSDLGRHQNALEIQQEIESTVVKTYGQEHPRSLHILHDLAVTLRLDRQLEEAKDASLRVLELNEKIYGPNHPRTINIIHNLAHVLINQEAYKEAEVHFRRALEHYQDPQFNSFNDTVSCMRSIAWCLEHQYSYNTALIYYENVYEEVLGTSGVSEDVVSAAKVDITRLQGLLSPAAQDRRYPASIYTAPLSPAYAGTYSGGQQEDGPTQYYFSHAPTSAQGYPYQMPADPYYGR